MNEREEFSLGNINRKKLETGTRKVKTCKIPMQKKVKKNEKK